RGGRRGAHRGHEDHEPPDPQTDPGAVDVVDDGEAAAVDGAAAVLARRRAPPGGRRGTEVVVEVPTGGPARTGAEVVLRCRRALGGPAAGAGRGRGHADVVGGGEAAAVDGAAAVLARRRAAPGGRRGTGVVGEVPTGGHARTGAEVVRRCRRALGGPAAEVGRGRHPVEVGSRGCG